MHTSPAPSRTRTTLPTLLLWAGLALSGELAWFAAAMVAWIPLLLPRVRRAPNTAALLLWIGLLMAPDALLGNPGVPRGLLTGLGGALALLLDSRACGPSGGARPWPRPHRRAFLLLGGALVAWAAIGLLPTSFGADRWIGQDTAYFSELVADVAAGRPPVSPMVTDLLYQPPIHHHFAAHFSPVLYALAPLGLGSDHWSLLAFFRSLMLLSIVGFVALALPERDRASRVFAPLVLSACALWYAPLHAVYLLAFAVPAAAICWLGISTDRRKWVWAGFVLALLVREDAALFVGTGAALVAWADGKQRASATATGLLGICWYLACTTWIMPSFGDASGQAIAVLFEETGGLLGFLSHPGRLLEQFTSTQALRSVILPLRATGFLGLLDPMVLAAVPAAGVNLLAGGRGFGTLEIYYHYALLPATAIGLAAVLALVRRRRDDGTVHLPAARIHWTALLAILLTAFTLGVLDTAHPDRLLPPSSLRDARAMRSFVEGLDVRGQRVVSVRSWLPQLGDADARFLAARYADYPDTGRIDLWILHENPAEVPIADDLQARYGRLLARVRGDSSFVLLKQQGPWLVYGRANPREGD